jgi:uncharacterized membrane protein
LTALPPWTYELVLAPAALALTLAHARRALGLPRALVEAGALAAYGYALEWTAIGVFRAHDYGRVWRAAPGGVPLAVAGVWASVILCTLTLAARRGLPTPGRRATAAALVALSLDVLMEPVAVRLGLWRWTPPGAWLGVPAGNFVGWLVVVTTWCAGAERDPFAAPLRRVAARRALLAGGSIAALLAVGVAWRALGLERGAGAAAGWIVAASAGLGVLIATGRRRPATAWPDTLGGRLGSTPGLGPEAAMTALVLGFAADAFATGDRAVRGVAVLSVTAVGFVSLASARFALSDAWRDRALHRFAGIQGLVRVLMKPPNGEAWTPEDRLLLRGELRALARWTPGLVLFVLPGGMLLLIVYAHLLDRRRLQRPRAKRERDSLPRARGGSRGGGAAPPCSIT